MLSGAIQPYQLPHNKDDFPFDLDTLVNKISDSLLPRIQATFSVDVLMRQLSTVVESQMQQAIAQILQQSSLNLDQVTKQLETVMQPHLNAMVKDVFAQMSSGQAAVQASMSPLHQDTLSPPPQPSSSHVSGVSNVQLASKSSAVPPSVPSTMSTVPLNLHSALATAKMFNVSCHLVFNGSYLH